MKTYLVFNEQGQRWVSKHYEADLKKSNNHFRKLGNNAAKLDALRASINKSKISETLLEAMAGALQRRKDLSNG